MKKFSFLVAAAALSLTASAATRVLYSETFEAAADPAAAGWTCTAGTLSLPADESGKMLLWELGNNNGRTADAAWGTEIYSDENGTPIIEDGAYDMSFEFSMPVFPNNQRNSAITVYTNYAPLANQPYRSRWSPSADTRVNNFLLDLTQIDGAYDGQCPFCVNGDSTDVVTLDVATFYGVKLHVNIEDRTVEYVITNLNSDEALTSGTYNVPASYMLVGNNGEETKTDVSMYAEGMHLMAARYYTQYAIDNIKITCEASEDFAAAPVVALSRIGKTADDVEDLNIRAYNITFNVGETLHVVGTDGSEVTADYEDASGVYEYETNTSGTLKAWTVSGKATSEVVEIEVDCTPYRLPEATATVVSVADGYSKTYSLWVDNSSVALQPTIFMYWSYEAANGNITTGDEPVTNGTKLTFEEAGVLTITSAAFGYAETSTKIYNETKYEQTLKIDFVHKTAEEIQLLGFSKEEDLNSPSTSGETNWTGRRGMYYYDGNTGTENPETGEISYDIVLPFGYVSADSPNVIHRYKMICTDLQAMDYYKDVFPGIWIWKDYNAQMKEGIGLVLNTMKQGDNEDGAGLPKAGTVDIKVPNLNSGDFVVVKKISNYGRDMAHPICMSADEYDLYVLANVSEVYAAAEEEGTGAYSVTFPLYRIDTALAGVEVYTPATSVISDMIEDSKANVILDNGYYSIDGIRYEQPTHTGIYIHQGKKVYIRK